MTDYLDKSCMQPRFGIVYSLLREISVRQKVIVDLNCGCDAPLLSYLPTGYALYYGNDVDLDWETAYGNGRVILERLDDEVLALRLQALLDRIDILIFLGHDDNESDTIDDTFINLVGQWLPEIVIHETMFEDAAQDVTNQIRNFGYTRQSRFWLQVDDNERVSSRIFSLFKRIEKSTGA